jgi:hypothetical protein
MKWLAFVALFGIALAPNAHAYCFYAGEFNTKTTLAQEFHDAPLVIMARAISSQDVPPVSSDEDASSGVISRVRVEQVFKGSPSKILEFFSERNSGGFDLDDGTDYLLFLIPIPSPDWANKYPGAFTVNYNCGQSRSWRLVSPADRAQLSQLTGRIKH